jgi:uncharacterized RDD family membrane protein YckC
MWILSSIIFIITAGVGIFSVLNYWIFIGAVIIIVYFTYMEGKTSSTLGKRVFSLRVVSESGEMNYKKAFIRNLSKILYLPLILDVILGFLFGKSNDRFLDKVSGTYVVTVEEQVNTHNELNRR